MRLVGRHWLAHELVFGLLALTTATAIAMRSPQNGWLIGETFAVTTIWAGIVGWLSHAHGPSGERLRVAVTYGMIVWFYSSVVRFVPALHIAIWDEALRAADDRLFGSMPATWVPVGAPAWITDVMSIGYVVFLFYVHCGFGVALWKAAPHSRSFLRRVGSAYAIGLSGYLLVPAIGPAGAFPDAMPKLAGGWLRHNVAAVIAWGSSRYDVFPSLHVLVTAAMLVFDWHHERTRFRVLLIPSAVIFGSTIYLGYHYAVDLLAAGLLIAGFWASGWWRFDVDLDASTGK